MSQLNPSEISSVLKEKIAGLDLSAERKNEGIIVSVSDGIVRIHGMGDVMFGELIEFENGVLGRRQRQMCIRDSNFTFKYLVRLLIFELFL